VVYSQGQKEANRQVNNYYEMRYQTKDLANVKIVFFREMQERVERKAQQEEEYLERVNAEFRDVYIDPNEP
jgi:hypothetical protein